jgi:serine/threonine protein kinase
MASFQPHTFGKYYLVDHIATGGMAEIYKAKTFGHGGFENLLVIKRILPHIGEKQDFVDMFIDEAKVSVALQHPNIVRLYDFGKLLDNYFMAMECVDGKDVRQVLRQLARNGVYLPFRFAAYIALETCKGLQYAHDKCDVDGNPYGIVHRDISPSNVLVSYEGEVKVADFGIAKAESNAYETKDGVLKGKFEYMSPEQAAGVPIDHRSDVFSLGIIFYEMLTGRRLFKTDSDTATLKKIRDEDVPAPSLVKPDVPPALEAIALKALRRDLGECYDSAGEMANDLRDYLFPATSDSLRTELAEFMGELFEQQIREERERLHEGSAVAAKLKSQRPEWDEYSQTGTLSVTQTAVKLVAPTMVGGGLMLLVVLALAGGGGYVAYT